jgi:SAM-dependent methyltransferase
MEFAGDFARIQQAATRAHEARRVATLQATDPKAGEAILEIGCGNGLFVRCLAEAVGSTGKACGIDLSEDQVAAARVNCAGLSNVDLQIANAFTLPFAQDSFDAVTTITHAGIHRRCAAGACGNAPRSQARRAPGELRDKLGRAVLEFGGAGPHAEDAPGLGFARALSELACAHQAASCRCRFLGSLPETGRRFELSVR